MEKLKVIDINGENILSNPVYDNLVSELIGKATKDIDEMKQNAFLFRLQELDIEIDFDEEIHRRFKRFVREIRGNEELIYFNDGSISGRLIITFITEQNCDFNLGKIGYSVKVK